MPTLRRRGKTRPQGHVPGAVLGDAPEFEQRGGAQSRAGLRHEGALLRQPRHATGRLPNFARGIPASHGGAPKQNGPARAGPPARPLDFCSPCHAMPRRRRCLFTWRRARQLPGGSVERTVRRLAPPAASRLCAPGGHRQRPAQPGSHLSNLYPKKTPPQTLAALALPADPQAPAVPHVRQTRGHRSRRRGRQSFARPAGISETLSAKEGGVAVSPRRPAGVLL